jgi:hypothetical protein
VEEFAVPEALADLAISGDEKQVREPKATQTSPRKKKAKTNAEQQDLPL